jgi:3-isopropylmalate/(R)-2-methylmalate dehydratase small subunit
MKVGENILRVAGRAISIRGNDIDTDRIIPARYLRCVTFSELGPHAFEDDRQEHQKQGKVHPFDDDRFSEASILFVNSNFGCGSSREHAPQSLLRWGIRAIVGESFAEIFLGNCVSLGIPCASLPHDQMLQIQDSSENDPSAEWIVDIEKEKLTGPVSFDISISAGAKSQFLSGTWNPLEELLKNSKEIKKIAESLPYISGF